MVTFSSVSIANMALDNVGASASIESFAENSPGAKVCKRWYDFARLQALEDFDWSFARKRQILAEHGDDLPLLSGASTSAYRWQYRYQWPADCVQFRFIENPLGPQADPIPFSIEVSDNGTKSILTDLENAVGVYTFDQANVSIFPMHFINTIAWLLASKIAYPITRKVDLVENCLKMYNIALRVAPARNANEQVQPPPREAEAIRARDA